MMFIDYESLIEFEDSLQASNAKDTSLTLKNLELKMEYNLVVPLNDTETAARYDIDHIFENYDYAHDEFTTCNSCGSAISSKKPCCVQFIKESKISSSLEKSFWLSFLDNPTRTINTMPNYAQFLFLQQGIPYQLRSVIWRRLFLTNYNNEVPQTSLLVYKNFQHSYNSETSDQIKKDLNRTFGIDFFHDDANSKELEIILNVYANYDVELGYCQGLLFLVGSLYYQFKDPLLTFHSLITIMESETELHDIFTQELMSVTLDRWYSEFSHILASIDAELYDHLSGFVDMKVFLYQWWLSFMSSHTPDFSIINRIMDFCLIQGWKVGMFKISAGILLINKPILMTLVKEDEEVIYQHLLNECKWGLALKDLNSFFGELLFSFEPILFMKKELNKPMKTHRRTHSSMMDKFKNLNISSYSLTQSSNSNASVFSRRNDDIANTESESIYSSVTTESSTSGSASKFVDYLKIPFASPTHTNAGQDIVKQNKAMKDLLARCLDVLEDEELKNEITQVIT
jgi:hypothetical protein